MTRELDQAIQQYGLIPLFPSANLALGISNFNQNIYPTAAITITVPAAFPGWQSGEIQNTTALAALTTIAVPNGATLDGVLNGTGILAPLQKARIVQIGVGTYITSWIERRPALSKTLLANATAFFTPNLPTVGYKSFDIVASGFVLTAASANVNIRFSYDNGVTVKSAAEYVGVVAQQNSGAQSNYRIETDYGGTYIPFYANSSGNTRGGSTLRGTLDPAQAAGPSVLPTFIGQAGGNNNTDDRNFCIEARHAPTTPYGIVTTLQFFSSGTMLAGANVTMIGNPA